MRSLSSFRTRCFRKDLILSYLILFPLFPARFDVREGDVATRDISAHGAVIVSEGQVIGATAMDDVAVLRVEFSVDGVFAHSDPTPNATGRYTFTLEAPAYDAESPSVTLTAVAIDSSGPGPEATLVVPIEDDLPPTVTTVDRGNVTITAHDVMTIAAINGTYTSI